MPEAAETAPSPATSGPLLGVREAVPVPAEPVVTEPPEATHEPTWLENVERFESAVTAWTPPGTVLVHGGVTLIGATVEEVEAMGHANELVFPSVVPETPQYERTVDDVHMMVSEVTNEQYAAFVHSTGARPPWMWGEEATSEGRAAFLESQQRMKEAAAAAGRPTPERKKFHADKWWAENWLGKAWSVPAYAETLPVGWVDYTDAVAYAEWAGMRLMTEFEYQRACRGDGAAKYPWGDDPPDPNRCADLDSRMNEPLRVAELPNGRSPDGVAHLAGNVWEWTASPFVPYPGHRDLVIEVGAGVNLRRIHGIVKWDPGQRVAVGGSYQNSDLAVRCTTRRPTDRNQTTDALGFRCAASPTPGADRIRAAVRAVGASAAWSELELDTERSVFADRWRAGAGTSPLPGYAVVEDYDHLLFIPALDRTYGVLVTTEPALVPPLPAGTHVVTFPSQLGEHEVTFATLAGQIRVTTTEPALSALPAPPGPTGGARDVLVMALCELVARERREAVTLASITPLAGRRLDLVFAGGFLGSAWRY
jgi:formylglycine-generating enzyme required for sulfatase activity